MAVTGEKTSGSLNGSHDAADDAEGQVQTHALPVCPPHTTERKLVTRIDLRVMPFLCVMYLLAFLGE